MDVVSRRFGKEFYRADGRLVPGTRVRLIGHVIEENGSHARLGYGPGHYFRAMDGLDMAGIDVVNNIYPGRRDGRFLTHFNNYDAQFNHWGLSKMASSCAHLDPRKRGNSVCEALGPTGWSEGLKTMKWITDAIVRQGINHIIPHAFPRWNFRIRIVLRIFMRAGITLSSGCFPCGRIMPTGCAHGFCDGVHVASAAVLYHGESGSGEGRAIPLKGGEGADAAPD